MRRFHTFTSLSLAIVILFAALSSVSPEASATSAGNRWLYDSYAHIDPSLVVHDLSLSRLGSVALTELNEGYRESPRGSGSIKYNAWYYGADVSNSTAGNGYLDEYGWNVTFITWCSDQLGYIDSGIMLRTADGGELLSWLMTTDAMVYTRGRVISQTAPVTVAQGDLIFLPANNIGFDVGIVTAADSETITYIFGDCDDTIKELSLKIEDLPEAACFARLYVTFSEKDTIYLFLKQELGLNDAAAAGVYANLYWESALDHSSIGDEGSSFGICQWHNGRWTKLVNFCNSHFYEWDSLDGQLRFLQYELETRYPELLGILRSVPDSKNGAYTAAFEFCTRFERPATMEEAGANRGKYAMQIYGTFEL